MLSSVRPPRARAVSLSEIAEPNSPHAASAGIAGGPDASPSPRKLEALELFDGLERRYDALSAAFSFWQDPRWRSAMVDALGLRGGERVLDVATGTGLVAAEMRKRGRTARSWRSTRARRCWPAPVPASPPCRGSHVELVQAEAERLPFPDESFDAVSFTYLLRYVDDPPATMRELARVLRPGGAIGSVEFGVPRFAPARAAWRLYTEIGLPLLGRAFSREWEQVGRFLGPSIRGFYEHHPQERVIGYWREAGLEQVALRRMSFGAGVVMSARKAPRPAGAG